MREIPRHGLQSPNLLEEKREGQNEIWNRYAYMLKKCLVEIGVYNRAMINMEHCFHNQSTTAGSHGTSKTGVMRNIPQAALEPTLGGSY